MSKCCGAGAMDLANPLLACTRVGFWLPAQCLEPRKLFIIPGLLTSNLRNCSFSYRYYCCILWQYGFWSFQAGCTKLERFLPKNQHTQRKLLNFENWVNGEVSKIRHHFKLGSETNRTTLGFDYFITVSGHFFSNYINSFHKNEDLTVILRCLETSYNLN